METKHAHVQDGGTHGQGQPARQGSEMENRDGQTATHGQWGDKLLSAMAQACYLD